jgi:hypothetical protein
MKQCRRPEFCGEAGTIEESPGPNRKLVVINFGGTILGGTVGAGGFDGVMEFT